MIRKKIIFAAIAFILFILAFFYYSLRSTLPPLQDSKIPGLSALVTVDFDPLGVPTITGQSLLDAIRGQGFVVARDRLFQMELTRRKMKGQLSEIFGRSALEFDKTSRMFNFDNVAREAYRRMAPANQEIFKAYAEGVNAWREKNPSFEMKLLRITTAPWEPSDSLLVILAMFQTLDRWDNQEEITFNLLEEKYGREVVEFLTQDYGFFDAVPVPDSPKPILPPSSKFLDVRKIHSEGAKSSSIEETPTLGSNAWAIPGEFTTSGKPILSGDPHLAVTMPNLWYRNRLIFQDDKTTTNEVVGASIPGIPMVVIGTNGHVAWTFTNAYSDTVDFVEVQKSDCISRTEKIPVRFSGIIEHTFCETKFGPVLESDSKGREFAIQWAALDPEALKKLDLSSFNTSKNVREAVEILKTWSGPVQNCYLADSSGGTAWMVVGRVPKRIGFDGRRTVPRDSKHFWDGYVSPDRMQLLINNGKILSSGNQRTSPYGKDLYLFASSWPSPARGFRINELFKEKRKWDVQSASGVQLDTLSVAHLWYRDQLLPILEKKKGPWATSITNLIRNWDGRLNVDSSAYLFLKRFRLNLFRTFLWPLIESLGEEERELVEDFFVQREEWLVQLLRTKPEHWLSSEFKTYEEALEAVAIKTAKTLVDAPDKLPEIRWGKVNKAVYQHPLTKLFPPLKSLLDLPQVELNGDSLVPRVERTRHSATLRMTVDLGNLRNSIYIQPGGQSGHPLSPNYKDQFQIWYEGKAVRLYPERVVGSFRLNP